MKEIYYLFKRNSALFLRDYSAVFFSMLSMVIILVLMVVFLGNMNSEQIVTVLEQYGGERDTVQDEANAEYLIQMWTLAGILAVNTVTVTLTVLQTMIQDEEKNRLASFYVTPVKRIKIALGYITSAWIIGSVMSMVTLMLGEGYMVCQGHELLAWMDLVKLFGMIALNAFVYASIGYLMALFIHSESAWGSMLTIIGTLVGFVGGIYLPISMLPESVGKVLKCLPVLHGAAMMRVILTKDAVEETFAGLPEVVKETFNEGMGITVKTDADEITLRNQILILAVYGIIAIVVAGWINNRRKLRDR